MSTAPLVRPEIFDDIQPHLSAETGTVEVQTFFRGIGLDTRLLPDPRAKSRAAAHRRAGFVIGSTPDADAPCDVACVPSASHALVSVVGGEYVVSSTAGMGGELCVDGQSYALPARGASFTLPPGAHARLECGSTTFVVRATSRPQPIPVPVVSWNRRELRYQLASLGALALFLLMIFSIPPDPKSLSLTDLDRDPRFLKTLIKPPVVPEDPVKLLGKPAAAGADGKRHNGPEGKTGSKTSRNNDGRLAIKGPANNENVQLAKQRAAQSYMKAGILGTLSKGGIIDDVLGRETLGNAAEDVLGNLVGSRIAEAYGVDGGKGVVGTGAGGGGTGEGTLGGGNGPLNTIGLGGNHGTGYGHCVGGGCGTGGIGRRVARAPEVVQGIAHIRGSLDKEIIRRIVHRHINEVKFCYEQELAKAPKLGGRIVVQFGIAASGQVFSSVLQSSTMGNVRVESCTVQAIRRWEFPHPEGGGLVIVSYPFVLTRPGGDS